MNHPYEHEVRETMSEALGNSESYRALSPRKRREVQQDLNRVMSYLSDPGAGEPELRAEAMRDEPVKAAGTGVAEEFGAMVSQVDFPAFVRSLITGVYDSVVDSSIKQMEAFTELLSSVVQSVDTFADINIPEAEARNHMLSKFPGMLQIGANGRLQSTGDEDPDFSSMGADAPTDLSDKESEAELVRRARLEMAKQKQQMLGTMVMLGINRIVITDGQINAKVVFNVSGRTSTKKSDTASDTGNTIRGDASVVNNSATSQGHPYAFAMASDPQQTSSSGNTNMVQMQVSTATADTSNKSDAELNASAQLTGEVKLRFKSETFPLDKVADTGLMSQLQQTSDPNQPNAGESYGGRGARPAPGPRGTYGGRFRFIEPNTQAPSQPARRPERRPAPQQSYGAPRRARGTRGTWTHP